MFATADGRSLSDNPSSQVARLFAVASILLDATWSMCENSNMSPTANNLDNLARSIRIRRKALRLTQQDLADLCGVQRQTVGRLEDADPTVSVGIVMAVADALGIRISTGGIST